MKETKVDEQYAKPNNSFKDELDAYNEIIKNTNELNTQITEAVWSGNLADIYRAKYNEFTPEFKKISGYLSKSSEDYSKSLNNILDQDEGVTVKCAKI